MTQETPEGGWKYDPIKALAQARAEQPALDAAYHRAEEEKRLYLEPVIEYFAHLAEEIEEMPIASRFSREHGPNFEFSGTGHDVLPQYQDLNEAEYKRAQLQIDLSTLRDKAIGLIGGVESLVLDMQATQQE